MSNLQSHCVCDTSNFLSQNHSYNTRPGTQLGEVTSSTAFWYNCGMTDSANSRII